MLSSILFILLLVIGAFLFIRNINRVVKNIRLGKKINRSDRPSERFKTMLMVALGQSKMVKKPIAGILHIIVYLGFVIINIEVLEIVIDGIFGTHRIFAFTGFLYNILIASFEFLGIGVLVACLIFLIRRNILKIKRFQMPEMTSWPKSDANYILIAEVILMSAFLTMNAADYLLQQAGNEHYIIAGAFPVSKTFIVPVLSGLSEGTLIFIERFTWWLHIVGIILFLNYLPYSKHLHILFAFPNTYFSNLKQKGAFTNLDSVTKEVKLMMDPNANPYATTTTEENEVLPEKFGAKDITDLNWKQLLDSYSCTECGRCTSNCPANITGKKLSPRKIMMDTRDRVEEIGKYKLKNGKDSDDGKSLLYDYIKEEELWACTSCNACTESCPVNIDPLSIIIDLRRFLVMEQSAAPNELNIMFNNIENNGAPWQFSMTDRLNWKNES